MLREGARRRHVLTAIAACTVADACLVVTGVLGFGAVVTTVPWLAGCLRGGGVLFLVLYATRALRAALRPAEAVALCAATSGGGRRVVTEALGYSILNPHSLLDTLVLLGGAATRYSAPGRLSFAAGAIAFSCVWFLSLGLGAAAFSRWLTRPEVQRGLDLFSALLMLWTALLLVRS